MYKLILPVRYLLKRRISLLAVLAVALCVFVVVVVMTVLTGLTGELKRKYHSFIGDCVVGSKSLVGFVYYQQFAEQLLRADFVEALSCVIKAPALLTVTDPDSSTIVWTSKPVELMGIDPVAHSRVTGLGEWLQPAAADIAGVFKPSHDPELAGCVSALVPVTQEPVNLMRLELPRLAYELSCFPLTAKGGLARAGLGLVNTKTFYLSRAVQVGLPRVDEEIVYVAFDQAQQLCGMDIGQPRANEIHIRFKPGVHLQTACEKVAAMWDEFCKTRQQEKGAELLSQVRVQSWKTYKRAVISALETEQAMMIFIFGLIGLVAVFIVFVVVYMVVSHKSKDIGILRSVGVCGGEVAQLFLTFGLVLGLAGTAIGAASGWLFLLHINRVADWLGHFDLRLWDWALYAAGNIPHRVKVSLFAVVIVCGIVACLIGALLPSLYAARRQPIETLQVSQL